MAEVNADVVTEREARRMSRWEALKTLEVAGDEEDRHMVRLLLAGPMLTEEDEERLRDWIPLAPPIAVAVHLALRELARADH